MPSLSEQAATIIQDLQQKDLSTSSQIKQLDDLKVLSRSPQSAAVIAKSKSLETLCDIAFHSTDDEVIYRALRPLVNTLFLQSDGRAALVQLQAPAKLVKQLAKSDQAENVFLCCRILLLVTYEPSFQVANFVNETRLADRINQLLNLHVSGVSPEKGSEDPMEAKALTELAKLLYVTVAFHSELQEHFQNAIEPIFDLISRYESMQARPLDEPVKALVNSLLNLDIFGEVSSTDCEVTVLEKRVAQLLDLLDMATKSYKGAEFSEAIPLMTLIRKTYDTAPSSIRGEIQRRALPSESDRNLPLGNSDRLSARLLRLTTSSTTPEIKDQILAFLFDLSDKQAAKFVRNIGLGFAAGFLMNHNIPMPEISNEVEPEGRAFNPVTGQFTADESSEPIEEMTEEEREREAERLFVLFERLKATGVVDVKNPVEEAARSGKLG